jgi:hypothetical protein
MRRITSATLGVSLVLSLVAVTAWFLMGGSDDGARAEGGSGLDPNVVGIDVEPSGNTATSLGTIDNCLEVSGVGSTFDVDVFLNDVPIVDSGPYHNLGGIEYRLIYDNTRLRVNATNHSYLLSSYAGYSFVDNGDCGPMIPTCPDTDGKLFTSLVGLGGDAGAEPPGSLGVLSRLTFEVVGGEGAFDYLTLTDLKLAGYETSVTAWADEIDQVWDSNYTPQYGIIAIGPASCAAVPSPTPTLTPPPTPTPTITPSPGAVSLVTGWNDSCYLGVAQPVEDALAGIVGHVLAVYRMRSDQQFDRWFPGRPDVSTITSLSPYDQLFILMAENAFWLPEPAGTPPTSVHLASGWNSVCYTGTAKEAQVATAGIAGQFSLVYTLAADQTWRRFVPGRPEVSNLTWLEPLTSLLILVTEESGTLWVFDP